MDTKDDWIAHLRSLRSQKAQRKKRWTQKHVDARINYTEIKVTQVKLVNDNPGDPTELVETTVHRKTHTDGNPEAVETIEKSTQQNVIPQLEREFMQFLTGGSE